MKTQTKTYYSAIPVDPNGPPVDFRYAAKQVEDRLWEMTASLAVDRDLATFKVEYVPGGTAGPGGDPFCGRIIASVDGVRR